MRTRMKAGLLAAAVLLAGACGGDGDGGSGPDPVPTPGYLTVNLSGGSAGAMLLTVSGGAVDTVEAAGTAVTVYSTASSTSSKVAVVGTVAPGALLRVKVPDTKKASSYTFTVNQVAEAGTYALQSVSGFTLAVAQ